MFGLESSTRYFMCQHPVSMRKGIDSLFNLVISESPMSPMTGDVFVFFSKNRQSVKLLRWDTDGFLLYQKRLERGFFEMPRKNADTGYYELSWETFSFIMSGIEAISHYGDVDWDNNCLERINRYISLSRHNSLFFGSHEGAKRGCIFYSLACSCRCNGINFFDYLSDVLNKAADLQHLTPEAYRNLLPDRWTKE